MIKMLVPDYFGQQVLSGIRALQKLGEQCDLAWNNLSLIRRLAPSRCIHNYFDITNSEESADDYIQDLVQLLKQNNYNYIMPFGLHSYYATSKHLSEIEKHTLAMVPSFDKFSIANDKLKTAKHCQSIGISTPKTFDDYKESDIPSIANDLNYPVVVKARSGCGVADCLRFAKDKKEFLAAYDELTSMAGESNNAFDYSYPLIQEYVPGYIHDACTLTANGEVLSILTQKRQVMYPISGGAGAYNITTDDFKLKDHARDILESLEWHGPAQVEFKYDERDKKYKLIEINPKLWGTLDLSIKAGMNFPVMIREFLIHGKTRFNQKYQVGAGYRFTMPQYSLALLEGLYRKKYNEYFNFVKPEIEYRDFDLKDPWPDIMRALYSVRKIASGSWKKNPSL